MKIFEHRGASKVNTSTLFEMLENNCLFKSEVESFILNNNIINDGNVINLPENTLISFIISLYNGYGFECDIRFTKDLIPVVFHDANLKRATANLYKKKISSLMYSDLKKIKINYGSNYYSYIPSLEETLKLNDDVILEFKDNYCSNSKLNILSNSLEKRNLNKIKIMSSNVFFLNKIKRKLINCEVGITLFNNKFLRLLYVSFFQNKYHFVSLNNLLINEKIINKNIYIGVSTIDGMNNLKNYRFDKNNTSFITNNPKLIEKNVANLHFK